MVTFRPCHLSVSAVQTYARCPAQYRARYVDRIVTPTTNPQAWGKAFHTALEALHRGQDAELAWLAAWNIAQRDALTSGMPSFGPSKLHGLELLEQFRQRGLADSTGEPERKFVLPFPSPKIPVPLLGYIDFTAPSDRHFRDYKTTSGSSWTAEKVALEHQLHVYGWAYQRIYHHRPDRALWVIFSTLTPTLEVIEGYPSPDGFRLFERQAEAVWEGIIEGKYDGCGECAICRPPDLKPAKGPVFEWSLTS